MSLCYYQIGIIVTNKFTKYIIDCQIFYYSRDNGVQLEI